MTARSLGTYTLVAAVVGLGGYLAHDAFAATPATSPVAVSAPSTQTPAAETITTTPAPVAARPIQIVVKGQPGQGHEKSPRKARQHGKRATTAGARAARPNATTAVATSDQRTSQVQVARSSASIKITNVNRVTDRRGDQGSRLVYQIVASDGSIVYVGDDGRLIANTGATSSSGVVALGVDGSNLSSGTSRSTSTNTVTDLGNESLQRLVGPGSHPTSVSGFEDHSVSVLGDDQVIAYDDSNVFLGRDGQINANTGDTDSSGLNVVDVTDSRVRSGDSGDGEGDDEEEPATQDDGAAPAEDDADDAGDDRQDNGQEHAETAEAVSGSGRAAGSASRQAGQSNRASVTDEGASTAEGDNPVVVGADGFDDVAIRSRGNGNVISYDDSNVVIGGSGGVNAQIGDSDTGGTVVMGVHGSDIAGGCEGDRCGRK